MEKVCWIGFAVLLLAFSASSQPTEVAPGVLQIGQTEDESVVEASGLTPSRRLRGAFWTHNDSGPDVLYGVGADGQALGQWTIKNVQMQNIEDIASTAGRLYVADIGNNTENRDDVFIHVISEPNPRLTGEVAPIQSIQLDYPGNDPFDAESLFFARGAGYIITKELSGGEASVYKFPLRGRKAGKLEEQCRLDVNAPVGGADFVRGKLGVITSAGAYLFVFEKNRIPTEGKIEPALFVPFSFDRVEGCAFTRDGLVAIAESGAIFLFTDPAFRVGSARTVLPGMRRR